ncbi:MAG TPA: hypothetical protein VEC11_16945 [Allosphingosinicella sp.]|nr:hypothetical protein [Allosphingosinicella sp.]
MLLSAALQAALAFNLVCTGTERAGPLGLALPESEARPWEISYRIDLDLRRWCSDACAETEAVGGIVLARILLRDRHDPEGSHVITFDPATGRLTDTLNHRDRMVLRQASCTRAAFTGFSNLAG